MTMSVSLRDCPYFKAPTSKEIRYVSRVLLDKSVEVTVGVVLLCVIVTLVLGYGCFSVSDAPTLVFYTLMFLASWCVTVYIVYLSAKFSKLYRPCHIASVRIKYTNRGTDYIARVKYHSIVFSDVFSVPSDIKLMVHRGEKVRVLVCLCENVLSLVYY